MFEWWQTLTLSLSTLVLGGLIAFASAYFQHRLTADASREAEERESRRRAEEEQRQARRQHRQERIQPVLDFLETAKRLEAFEQTWPRLRKRVIDQNILDEVTWKEFEASQRKRSDVPGQDAIIQAYYVADATATAPELREAVQNVVIPLLMNKECSAQIRAAEEAVEQYIVQV